MAGPASEGISFMENSRTANSPVWMRAVLADSGMSSPNRSGFRAISYSMLRGREVWLRNFRVYGFAQTHCPSVSGLIPAGCSCLRALSGAGRLNSAVMVVRMGLSREMLCMRGPS